VYAAGTAAQQLSQQARLYSHATRSIDESVFVSQRSAVTREAKPRAGLIDSLSMEMFTCWKRVETNW